MTRPQYQPTEYTAAVAAALQAERAASGLSVDALSANSGVPVRTLWRVLSAQRDITTAQLAALAPVFGLRPSELLAEAERRSARNTDS